MTRRGVSRRGFLNLVGQGGGGAALYHTMAAMGLLAAPRAYAGPPQLAAAPGKANRVVILGAGIAGMTAAYELSRAGYRCTVLEARHRAGGRNWTIRHGDAVEETGSRQVCGFDPGEQLYFNAGPARIPQHHQALLGYCKRFGVALEVLVNDNRNALLQSDAAFDGRPLRARQVINDARGHVAELLAKAVDRHALDQELSTEDRERLLAYLRGFGALTRDLAYRGSFRSGFVEPPGAGVRTGRSNPPLDPRALMKSGYLLAQTNFGELLDFANPMLQPVGGMDRIARAFEREVRALITFGAEVRAIRREGDGVRTIYRRAKDAADTSIAADYAICTLPLPVLAKVDADFSPPFRQAIASARYVGAAKLAFQARSRFWEEDDQIYGGISWTDQDVTQLWYPSTGFHADRGILVGAYIWSDAIGERFGAMTPEQRVALAIRCGQKLHARYADQVAHGISVAWSKIPYSHGAWAEWSFDQRRAAYATLLEPDGPIHLAGEHLSYLTGWQEGAILSAHDAVAAIDRRARN